MTKLRAMLIKHKAESNQWKGIIRPKIEEKMKNNIAKSEPYYVSPLRETFFGVFIGETIYNVNIMAKTCTCRGYDLFGIPYGHAYAVTLFLQQTVVDFFDDMFRYPTQQLVYSSVFHSIETHDMPKVHDDIVVQDVLENVFFSLKPPHTKRPHGRRAQ